jgi:dTDP-4-dehydrorhamnose 3,5-epimerase-like enzyme
MELSRGRNRKVKVTRVWFNVKGDERGSLVALESGKDIPFDIKSVYYIYNTKEKVIRGKHAHLSLKQVLICVHGSCTLVLDNGIEHTDILLSRPDEGIVIDSLIWREMKDFSSDAVLLVLASELYNEDDYIRNYDVFLQQVKQQDRRR